MKTNKGQEEIIKFCQKNGRIPSFDEAFDIYTDHVLKSQTECWMTVNGEKSFDKPLWRIKDSAWSWFKFAMGTLVIKGKLKIKIGETS